MRSYEMVVVLGVAVGIELFGPLPSGIRDARGAEQAAHGPGAAPASAGERGRPAAEPIPGPRGAETTATVSPFTLSMTVRVAAKSQLGWRSMKSGDVAHSGDGFTIRTWADRPVYLYFVTYHHDGWSSLLFPTAQHTMVGPGETIQLPARGGHYRLNQQTGEVMFVAYASAKPLDEKGCALLRLACPLWTDEPRIRGDSSERKDAPSPPPPPPHRPAGPASPTNRSPTAQEIGEDYVVSIPSDAEGNALLPFRFIHAL